MTNHNYPSQLKYSRPGDYLSIVTYKSVWGRATTGAHDGQLHVFVSHMEPLYVNSVWPFNYLQGKSLKVYYYKFKVDNWIYTAGL